jgi:hypothetical protein
MDFEHMKFKELVDEKDGQRREKDGQRREKDGQRREKDGQRRKRFLKFLREEIPAEMKRRVEQEEKRETQ